MIKGFKNVNVLLEGQGVQKKSIIVENGKIVKIIDNCDCPELLTLSDDKIVVPGFIDKHVHGGNNILQVTPADSLRSSINTSYPFASKALCNSIAFSNPSVPTLSIGIT